MTNPSTENGVTRPESGRHARPRGSVAPVGWGTRVRLGFSSCGER